MKKILPVLLCLCLLFVGCVQEAAPTTLPTEDLPAPTETPTTEPATETTTEATTEPTTVPTTEPVLLYQHPLTGESIDAPVTEKPVAVVINNIRYAQPFHGVGNADVLCEIMAEGGGGITRMLAVFTDLENAGAVGSIRSARTYFVDLARSFGTAPLVHCGGSEYALSEIRKTEYPSFNQSYNAKYFYRDQPRKNAGYAHEHTLFAQGATLMQGIQDVGFQLALEQPLDLGWQFSDTVALDGQAANKLTCQFYSTGGKKTVMEYDEQTGAYFGTQLWKDKTTAMYDGNTDEGIPFKNVLMIFAKTTRSADGHMFAELEGQGTGWFACEGKAVAIKWVRESKTAPFSFFLEDGTPITMGVGKTYLGVLAIGSPDVVIE